MNQNVLDIFGCQLGRFFDQDLWKTILFLDLSDYGQAQQQFNFRQGVNPEAYILSFPVAPIGKEQLAVEIPEKQGIG